MTRTIGWAGPVLLAAMTQTLWAAGATLHKSGPIQITADGQFVWVVAPDHDAVARLRTVDLTVDVFSLPAAGAPHEPTGLDVSGDGSMVWVTAPRSDRVFVLDGASGAVLDTVVLHHGCAPTHVALSPDGATALVTLHRCGAVARLDTATATVTAQIDGLFRRPFGIAFDSNTSAWITHTITDGEDGHVTGLDVAAATVRMHDLMKSVNPKEVAQISGEADPIPEGGYIVGRGHPAVLAPADRVWLPVQYQNFHNDVFTPDSTVQAAIHKIDLTTGEHLGTSDRVVLSAVYAHSNNSLLGNGWDAAISGPEDLAFSSDGQTAWLVSAYSNDVVVLDTAIGMVRSGPSLTEIAVGDNPLGVVAHPTADRAYVMNYLSRDVSVIDTATRTEITRVPITPGLAEPIPPPLLLGAKLFNSSADPRLSAGKVACASCHLHGGTDGLPWAFAQFGTGSRKTLRLQGLGQVMAPQAGGLGQLHRSGDRDEVQDFEHTIRGPAMGGSGLMAVPPNADLGPPNAGISADLDALAAYVLSLPALARSPHRAGDGSLTAAAERGAALFRNNTGGSLDAGCQGCHPAPLYTDLDYHDVGGHTPGTELLGPVANTPSLVGAWDDAPYVQTVGWSDGLTLGGVVRSAQYPSGGAQDHGNTSGLTHTQRRDLEAFLLSVDGDLAADDLATVSDTQGPRVVALRPISLASAVVVFDETVDPTTATDPAHYAFTDGVTTIGATAATVDAAWGNRVVVDVPLAYAGCPVTYTLIPGPIEDVAGSVAGGANNVLDVGAAGNRPSFTLDGTLTVTFGDSGTETFAGVAVDAGIIAGLTNWSHSRWVVEPASSPPMKGFIRFDFVNTLISACGVQASAEILSASFTNLPDYGHRATLRLRRCLKPWGEPPNDWCANCPGAVTVNHATRTSIPWSTSGARNYGGSGAVVADFYPNSAFDLAATIDLTVQIPAMNAAVTFAGAAVTDAFRFWFDNPSVNYGYAVEALPGEPHAVFHGNDTEGGTLGATLAITLALTPNTAGCLYGDVDRNGVVDLDDVLCVVDAFQGQFTLCSFEAVDIAPCAPDGFVDLNDIVAALDAFAGTPPCP